MLIHNSLTESLSHMASGKMSSSATMSYADIPVVPLGKQLSLFGWTPEQVQEAVIPNVPTDVLCWHCCHGFQWVPCRMPLLRDNRAQKVGASQNLYYSRGTFCSWNCCKQYALQQPRTLTCGAALIALLANKSRHLYPDQKTNASNGILLLRADSREVLKAFGGQSTIEEYRNGFIRFDGSICGEGDAMDWLLPKRPRRDYVPPAFIDNSIVTIVRCCTEAGVLSRTEASGFSSKYGSGVVRKRGGAHLSVPTHPGPEPISIREKMNESKLKRQAPITQRGGSVTLDSSMGIKVKRKFARG